MKRSVNRLVPAAILLVAMAAMGCQDNINYLRARRSLNSGVKAFQAADFPRAAEHFSSAIELDPALIDARSYRASAYMMQYVPGGESAENDRVAQQALDGFQEVLKEDPNNEVALLSMASLYFNMKEFDKAKNAYLGLVETYPNNKEAHYTIGVIAWTQTYQPRLEVRAELGMKPDDPGPIRDQKAREELAQTSLPLVEEGLRHLERSIEIDPMYNDAMAYVNLLYREQADLADNPADYEKYSGMADEWVQRALDTAKQKAEAGTQDAF